MAGDRRHLKQRRVRSAACASAALALVAFAGHLTAVASDEPIVLVVNDDRLTPLPAGWDELVAAMREIQDAHDVLYDQQESHDLDDEAYWDAMDRLYAKALTDERLTALEHAMQIAAEAVSVNSRASTNGFVPDKVASQVVGVLGTTIRGLRQNMREAAAVQQWDTVLRNLDIGFDLCRIMRGVPHFAISARNSVSIALYAQVIREIAWQDDVPDAMLRAMLARLQDVPFPTLEESRNEAIWMLLMESQTEYGSRGYRLVDSLTRSDGVNPDASILRRAYTALVQLEARRECKEAMTAQLDALIELWMQPDRHSRADRLSAWEDTLSLSTHGRKDSRRFSRAISTAMHYRCLQLGQHEEYLAGIAASRIECAIARYRLHHGALPETLDALAPMFIDTIPIDPVRNGPFAYRLTDDDRGYLLFSLGENGRDDGTRLRSHSGPVGPEPWATDDFEWN